MKKELLVISDMYTYKNKSFLSYYFLGFGDLEEKEKLKETLYRIFKVDAGPIYTISEIITRFRTAFKKFEELRLEISIGIPNEIQTVKYHNKELIYYNSMKPLIINGEEEYYKFEYEKENGLNIFASKENCKNLSDKNYITKEIKLLSTLHEITPLEIIIDGKKLCEIYQAFFQETPNFSERNTRMKTHAMMSLLNYYNISLGEHYHFGMQYGDILASLELNKLMLDLSLFGEIPKEKNGLISENEIKRIELIGAEICDFIKQTPNRYQTLKEIAKVSYSKAHNLHSDDRFIVEQICKNTKVKEENVRTHLRLVKKIEKRMLSQEE